MTSTQGLLIAGGCVLILGVVLWWARSGMAKDDATGEGLDQTVVEEYCRLVASGGYAEAYHKTLSADYRQQAPLDRFIAGHEKRKASVGVLQKRSLERVKASSNLFSGTREFQLLYELTYPSGTQRQYLVVNNADGSYRVDGTYTMSANDTLSFMLW